MEELYKIRGRLVIYDISKVFNCHDCVLRDECSINDDTPECAELDYGTFTNYITSLYSVKYYGKCYKD